jgi:hypothetical protein
MCQENEDRRVGTTQALVRKRTVVSCYEVIHLICGIFLSSFLFPKKLVKRAHSLSHQDSRKTLAPVRGG